ncbi:MAG: hypothetical protein DSY70_02115 [Desulfobulbus sp.]|nr:MAG: hypothetical protein DSY70_02115 [Desulfobulbus sp.]
MNRIKGITIAFLLLTDVVMLGCAGNQQTAVAPAPENVSAPESIDEADHGCSYFYFLWARYAELSGKNEEALEAYEKALICDPSASLAIRKIPLLLARLERSNEAISRLEAYLVDHPEDIEPRMVLAKVFIRNKQLQKAAAQYRKIHTIDPRDISSLLLLSELYQADGKPELARYALEDALEVDSQSYSARVLLARLLTAEKEFDKARAHYREALTINWSASLQLELAEVYLQQKKYDQAIRLYRDLLTRDEFNEEARVALVHVYLLQNKEQLALNELNTLKSITSRPGRVDMTIARLYARKKDYDKAVSILTDLLKKSDNGEIRYMLAILHYQTKQYKKTLIDLQGISRDAEEYEDGIFLQVRALRELHQNEQAIALLESVIAEEKIRNPDMFVLLASLYQLNNQDELGKTTFVRGIQEYPEDDQLLYEYGLFLDYSGEQQQALDIMQKVIQLSPEHAAALNYVGYSWADKKIHLDNALSYIRRAVELKPENGYIRDSLGWVYYRQGRLKEAVKALEQAIKLSPDDPSILDHLGDVYLEIGRSDDALEMYKRAFQLFDKKKDRQRLQEKIKIFLKQEED